MKFEEWRAKLILKKFDITIPKGSKANTPDEAYDIASELGPCIVKVQVPTGKRGKAGGIQLASTAQLARTHTHNLLNMVIGNYKASSVLIEEQILSKKELYVAILNDSTTKSPVLLFSIHGGMDVEEVYEKHPHAMKKIVIDITKGLQHEDIKEMLSDCDIGITFNTIQDLLLKLYKVYRETDSELVEINPLVITQEDELIALDCKFVLDDSAISRHIDLAKDGVPETRTQLEERASLSDLKYIELDGNIGILANGAGLTMTTMDMIAHYGAKPANFMEIGGEAYTKATEALSIVLDNPNVKSLVVNFCGAFARTDIMVEGVINAWSTLQPNIPVFFTIHGTGEERAIKLVKEKLGITPYRLGDDAVKAAILATKEAGNDTTITP